MRKSVAAAWAAVWLYLIREVESEEFCAVASQHLVPQFEEQTNG